MNILFKSIPMLILKLLSFGNNTSSDFNDIDEIGRMDDFTLLEILDRLDFDDLISIASINPRLQYLVSKHFLIPEFHLDDNRFIILLGDGHENNAIDIRLIDNQRPPLRGSEMFRMFRITGPIFTKLTIYNRTSSKNSDELTMVWQYVNKYCTNSLKEIVVSDTADRELLNEWKLPFGNCKQVTFSNSEIITDVHLNDLFPRIEVLVIDYSDKFVSLECLKHHVPHLKSVTLKISHNNQSRQAVEVFIRLNPQMIDIDLPSFGDFAFVKYLNVKLLKLETLSISGDWRDLTRSEATDTVLFKTVTKLKWRLNKQQIKFVNGNDRFIWLEFNQLQTIEISLDYTKLSNKTLDAVIEKYNGVEVFSLKACFVTYEQLENTVRSLAKLKEIILEWNISITRNILLELIESNVITNLEKITICYPTHNFARTDVEAAFPTQWILSNSYILESQEYLSFLRPF